MKTTLYLFAFALFSSLASLGQDTATYVLLTEVDRAPQTEECSEVEFPQEHMRCIQMFINQHIVDTFEYPEEAKEKNITGRVIVRFVIDKEGIVRDVTVVRSAHELLDREAVRVVSSLPQFQPAQKDGKNVGVRFYFPMNLQL